jgi:hypothetical protein
VVKMKKLQKQLLFRWLLVAVRDWNPPKQPPHFANKSGARCAYLWVISKVERPKSLLPVNKSTTLMTKCSPELRPSKTRIMEHSRDGLQRLNHNSIRLHMSSFSRFALAHRESLSLKVQIGDRI